MQNVDQCFFLSVNRTPLQVKFHKGKKNNSFFFIHLTISSLFNSHSTNNLHFSSITNKNAIVHHIYHFALNSKIEWKHTKSFFTRSSSFYIYFLLSVLLRSFHYTEYVLLGTLYSSS